MKFIIFCLLFFPFNSHGIEPGQDAILGLVIKDHGKFSLNLSRVSYSRERTDEDHRSAAATDLRAVLKDKNGKEIESAFLLLKQTGNMSFAKRSKQNNENSRSLPHMFDSARVNFLATPNAFIVELREKNKLVAKALVPKKNEQTKN
ncbi:MAG: hypothetical protein AB7K68_00725 [Bacteriovoracia bacterium]